MFTKTKSMKFDNENFVCSLYESTYLSLGGKKLRDSIDYALSKQGLCVKNGKLEREEPSTAGYEFDEITQQWVFKIKKDVAYVCKSTEGLPEGLFTVGKTYFCRLDNILPTDIEFKDWKFYEQSQLKNFRTWEIEDAQYGDIIVLGGNKFVMYRTHIQGSWKDTVCIDPICYFVVRTGYDMRFELPEKGQAPLEYKRSAIRPADKEQERIFTMSLAEHGYTWDESKQGLACINHFFSFNDISTKRKEDRRQKEISLLNDEIKNLLQKHHCCLEIGTSKYGGDGIYLCACERHPSEWDERLCNITNEKQKKK